MPAATLLAELKKSDLFLAVAESLTGGALASELVSIPGSSEVFLGSIVADQTELKHSILGVSSQLLASAGPVNQDVAAQMAVGVRTKLAVDLKLELANVVGVSTTGVAGPEPQCGQPVGQVFIGVDSAFGQFSFSFLFEGDRNSIRQQTVDTAIRVLEEHISGKSSSSI